MLIDTHCHLNFKAFEKDIDEVINRAKNAGVKKFIIPGAKIDSSRIAVEIAQEYDSCFAAVGIHPHHISEFMEFGTAKVVSEITKLIIDKAVVAIGEIGMDYHEYKGYPPVDRKTKNLQKELLLLQIDIAQKHSLPIIFHCRDAHDDQLELIENYIKYGGKQITGVFHCFGGEKRHLQKVLEMGFYVGFDGNITYPQNKNLQELVRLTPPDKLLLETDSPYLTPIPLRGQRNEPANLIHTASFTASIKQISPKKLAEITTRNALKLFKL